jgi:tetratricopeptide (TPR) repeat protein
MGMIGQRHLTVVFIFFLISLLIPAVRADEMNIPDPLEAPAGSPGAKPHAEGLKQYRRREWGVAEEQFREAIKADPKLAQAHYNLALALDQLGSHKDAARHFEEALKLAPQEKGIADSPILKTHLEKMKK